MRCADFCSTGLMYRPPLFFSLSLSLFTLTFISLLGLSVCLIISLPWLLTIRPISRSRLTLFSAALCQQHCASKYWGQNYILLICSRTELIGLICIEGTRQTCFFLQVVTWPQRALVSTKCQCCVGFPFLLTVCSHSEIWNSELNWFPFSSWVEFKFELNSWIEMTGKERYFLWISLNNVFFLNLNM